MPECPVCFRSPYGLLAMQPRLGIVNAVLAYTIWGLFPIYWKWFGSIPATEILSHRILWSSIFLFGVLVIRHQLRAFKDRFHSPRQWLPLLGTATILSINWGLYVYGVSNDRIVETSLGYFINPLVNVLLGVLILRERLNWGQWLAVAVAAIGVAYSVLGLGHFPWLALTLAVSFGFYGLLRKVISVEPLVGLTVETSLLAPVAIAYLGDLGLHNHSHWGHSIPLTALFIGCGIVTALPLLCFNFAAQQLRLSTLGFFQYIAPSLQLGLGIWVYHEPFTFAHALTFGCIWLALACYSAASLTLKPAPQLRPHQR